MKTLFNFMAVVFISLLLSGCTQNFNMMGTPAQNAQNSAMPDWLLNPMKSNGMNYYGIGQGNNQEEAKVSALSQIASEISVSVSSEMAITKKTTQDTYSKEIESNLKSSVANINFTSATIEKNHFMNGKFYSLVSVNRNALYQSKKTELDNLVADVNSLWSFVKKDGVFALLVRQDEIGTKIGSALALVRLTKTINSDFDDKSYDKKLYGISNSVRDIKSKMAVVVTSTNAKEYATVLKKSLSANGIKLVSSETLSSNMIKISLSKSARERYVKTTSAKLKDAKFALVDVLVKTQNHLNKTVAQNVVKLNNISTVSYEDAVVKTSKFDSVLSEKGLMFVLTGKE